MTMAQQFPTSVNVIYDTLSADTTFMSYLGTYDFKTGQGPLPALSVVSAGEDLPALRNVEGVECIIQDTGNVTQRAYLTGDLDVQTTWQVFLVAWNPAKGSDLQNATSRIVQRFMGASSTQTVATSDGLGALVQTKVVISSENPVIPL